MTVTYGDVSALNPEWWAMEGLVVLQENLVMANLVSMDYNDEIANSGDTVHVHKAGTFEAKHKDKGEQTDPQDAVATDTLVKLDQHLETTFFIDDVDERTSLRSLRDMFLVPAVRSIAEGIDGALVGEVGNFSPNFAGTAGVKTTSSDLVELDRVFNDNLAPQDSRNLVVGPVGKANLMNVDRFITRDFQADGTNSIITGRIGEVMGFNVYMSQTMGTIRSNKGANVVTEEVDGDHAKGSTELSIDTPLSAAIEKGQYITIEGVAGIYRVTEDASSPDDAISITPGLAGAVENGADITVYKKDQDSTGSANIAGQNKVVLANAPDYLQKGDYVAFDDENPVVYRITNISTATLTLSRPLEATVSAGDSVYPLPTGGSSYNFAFRPDALTLVNRPLSPAAQGAGVASAVVNDGRLSLRVTIGYDMRYMKHIITVDTLLGVKTLDRDQGAVLFC